MKSIKHLVFFTLVFSTFNVLYAQINLIKNGSFEVTDSCPNQVGQVSLAKGWHNASATADLLDSCASFWAVDVPSNYFGSSYAKSGSRYVHINLAWYDSITVYNYETICYTLDEPLKAGHKYCLSFWVKHTNYSRYAYDRLGVLFTSTYYNQLGGRITEKPQFETPPGQPLTYDEWTEITTEFVANGTEKYMLVGQFNKFEDLTIVDDNPNVPLDFFDYYVDDFSLINCTNPPEIEIPNTFSPNGDLVNDEFRITAANIQSLKIEVYSRWGTKVFKSEEIDFYWDGTFNGTNVAEGVYFYIINYVGTNDEQKQMNGSIHLFR